MYIVHRDNAHVHVHVVVHVLYYLDILGNLHVQYMYMYIFEATRRYWGTLSAYAIHTCTCRFPRDIQQICWKIYINK